MCRGCFLLSYDYTKCSQNCIRRIYVTKDKHTATVHCGAKFPLPRANLILAVIRRRCDLCGKPGLISAVIGRQCNVCGRTGLISAVIRRQLRLRGKNLPQKRSSFPMSADSLIFLPQKDNNKAMTADLNLRLP